MNREQAILELAYSYPTWESVEDSITEIEIIPGWTYYYGRVVNDGGNELPITENDFNEAIKCIKTQFTNANIEEVVQEHKCTPEQQESIDYIMDCFDFRKVDKIMRKLKWKWYMSEINHDDTGTPKEISLRLMARDLLIRSIKSESGISSSSGFEATYNKDDGVFFLKFILTDWHSYVSE